MINSLELCDFEIANNMYHEIENSVFFTSQMSGNDDYELLLRLLNQYHENPYELQPLVDQYKKQWLLSTVALIENYFELAQKQGQIFFDQYRPNVHGGFFKFVLLRAELVLRNSLKAKVILDALYENQQHDFYYYFFMLRIALLEHDYSQTQKIGF